MNINVELLKEWVADHIVNNMEDFEIDADKIADSTAIKALSEIQQILKSDDYDEEVVEKIVSVFEKYHLDFGSCHDY